jgi:hypothetical protein
MTKIYQFPTPIPMTNGNYPQFKFAVFGDNLATITTSGYLNSYSIEAGMPLSNADVIMCLFSFNQQTNTGSFGIFTVNIATSTGQITLSEWTGTSGVILPTIANHIATYTNTTGTLSEDPATAISGGNIQAGLSGTAGTLASFPVTASKGSLVISATANTGNTTTTITNAAMGQASVLTLPDPGGASADFALAPAALVNNNLVKASGTAGLIADAGIATANVMQTNVVNTMTAPGQIILAKANGTEATNAVTASGNAGVITTSSLTTAGGSSYAITWTNTLISSTSAILLTIMGGTNTTENITLKATAGTGTSTLTIYNNTAATALNGTILIGYAVL